MNNKQENFRNVLKQLVVDLSKNDYQINELFEASPTSNPSDVKSKTDTIKNVKFANNFTNSFSIKVGDSMAVPILTMGEVPRHVVLKFTETKNGIVESKDLLLLYDLINSLLILQYG